MNEDDALSALSALSNRSRLAVLRLLVKAGPDGMPAGQIAQTLGAGPSHISFHLAALSEGGLVLTERRSRQILYRTNFGTFRDLVAFVLEDCCGGTVRPEECCR